MTFGVNKCATMVIKPLNYVSPLFSSEPTFYLGMYAIPKLPLIYTWVFHLPMI